MLNCLDVSLVISVLLSWRQTLLVYAFWSADRSRLLLHQPPGFHVQTDLTIARDRVIGVERLPEVLEDGDLEAVRVENLDGGRGGPARGKLGELREIGAQKRKIEIGRDDHPLGEAGYRSNSAGHSDRRAGYHDCDRREETSHRRRGGDRSGGDVDLKSR